MLKLLPQLIAQVADLGFDLELQAEEKDGRINWRFRGADQASNAPWIVNASGHANDENSAIRDIIRAAHEQLWEGVVLEAPSVAEVSE